MFKKKVAVAASAPADAAPGLSRARTLLAVAGLGAITLAAAAVWFFLAISPPDGGAAGAEVLPRADTSANLLDSASLPPGTDLRVMPFEEIIVNITTTNAAGQGTARFMKLDLALVFDVKKDPDGLVETRHLYMRDAFQDYLRHLTERDLDGTAGLVTVKSELLRRARAIAGSNAPYEMLVLGLVLQ